MGSAFRGALIAGLQTDAVELVPCVPEMFGYYYPDADAVLADPNGRVIVTDGRNHLELTDERFDIIVTDPPPPIESSGASVISSQEYYEAGRDHLTAGGIMMQWVPYGGPAAEFKDHVRTFAAVFPEVDAGQGRGRLRRLHARLVAADRLRRGGHPRGPRPARRPRGHLVGLRLAGQDRRRLGRRHRAPDLADRRRGPSRRPATARSSRTTARDPNTSCCAACSAAGCHDPFFSLDRGAPPATMTPPTTAGGRMTARTLTASRALLGTTLPFAIPIGLSAFLLFSVEPLVGRLVLPVFGGTPAVWTTALFFFQAVLLAGYLYGHVSVTRLGQWGPPVHLALAGLGFAALVIAPAHVADLRIDDAAAGRSTCCGSCSSWSACRPSS